MAFRIRNLLGMSVADADGPIGRIDNVHFDVHRWIARYLLVTTGDWLMGRKVLISPISVDRMDWPARTVRISLDRDQIRHCPDTDAPASRSQEMALLKHYGYPDYFVGGLQWGTTPYPDVIEHRPAPNSAAMTSYCPTGEHLLSLKSVIGYVIQASDMAVGQLDDFLLDERSWEMRYAVVNTSSDWLGKQVVIPPMWIDHLDWKDKKVHVDVAGDKVAFAPDYDARTGITRGYESALYEHYARPGLWT